MRPVREGEEVRRTVAVLIDTDALRFSRTQPARIARAWISIRIRVRNRIVESIKRHALWRAWTERPRAAHAEIVRPVRPRFHFKRRDVVANIREAVTVEWIEDTVGRRIDIAIYRVALRVKRWRKAWPR